MTKYIGVKQIEAKPMTRGEYNHFRGWTIPKDENPNDKGFLVMYSDGYVSWSPEKQFKEAYRAAGSDVLCDTIPLMLSSDYKERFRAEYRQLTERYKKLKAMCEKWDADKLEFKPACNRSVFDIQMKAMRDYINVLEERAKVEGVLL